MNKLREEIIKVVNIIKMLLPEKVTCPVCNGRGIAKLARIDGRPDYMKCFECHGRKYIFMRLKPYPWQLKTLLSSQEITGKHYPNVCGDLFAIKDIDVSEYDNIRPTLHSAKGLVMISSTHEQWLSADKLVEHMQLTKPLQNVEDYQYRNCPQCGGKGTALATPDIYQCDECKYVYTGFKHVDYQAIDTSDETIRCPRCGGGGEIQSLIIGIYEVCPVCNGKGILGPIVSGDGTGKALPTLSRHDNIDDNTVKNSIRGTTYVPKLGERDNENKPPRYCR